MSVRARSQAILLALAALACSEYAPDQSSVDAPDPPYPPSPVIAGIVWHPETHVSAAQGSDLWPTTWAADDHLYAAWGDGHGFGEWDGKTKNSLGIARIEGGPTDFRAYNVNGGVDSEFPPTWTCRSGCGKTAGIISVDGILYAWINLQNGPWPNVDFTLAWSADRGSTWEQAPWVFPAGAGNLRLGTFLNVDRDHRGGGPFVYSYGTRQSHDENAYLARTPREKLESREAYEFFVERIEDGEVVWSPDIEAAQPVFTDPGGGGAGQVVFNASVERYLMVNSRDSGGQVGVFDAPEPWGPWTTVAYYEDWLGADGGHGLSYSFVPKWTSPDGLTMWMVFSANGGAPQYHDRFNLVKATLRLRDVVDQAVAPGFNEAVQDSRRGQARPVTLTALDG
jgi:hypothetical protein